MSSKRKLNQARSHHNYSLVLLKEFDDQITRILGDECAHLSFSTDGLVLVYDDVCQAAVSLFDFDKFLSLDCPVEARKLLSKAGI